jgi:chromosome segregation ATPase
MRTDRPAQEQETNPHLAEALSMVEKEITDLYKAIADNEDSIRACQKRIVEFKAELDVAETAKKFIARAIVDSNEAQRYLGGGIGS